MMRKAMEMSLESATAGMRMGAGADGEEGMDEDMKKAMQQSLLEAALRE